MESLGIVTAQKSILQLDNNANKQASGRMKYFFLRSNKTIAFIDVVWPCCLICHQPGTSNFKSNIVHFADLGYFKTVYLITVNRRFSLI